MVREYHCSKTVLCYAYLYSIVRFGMMLALLCYNLTRSWTKTKYWLALKFFTIVFAFCMNIYYFDIQNKVLGVCLLK